MEITTDMAMTVLQKEAIVRQAYKDSVGVWTWSGGVTSKSGHRVERYIGKPQPMERCLEVYLWLLQQYLDDVAEAFKGHDLTIEQQTAALSFNWNTRAIKRASWVKHFRAGRLDQAEKSIMSWRKPPEIISRREYERDLFFRDAKLHKGNTCLEITKLNSKSQPIWSSGKQVEVRSMINRILNGEPAKEPSPTLTRLAAKDRVSTTELAAGVTTVGTVAATAKQISDDVGGIAMNLPPWAIYVAAGAALAGIFWAWKERRAYKAKARQEIET